MQGINKFPLPFTAASALERGRVVSLTRSTNTVAYATPGSTPYGITDARGSDTLCSAFPLDNLEGSVFVEAAGTIAKGGELIVGLAGKVIGKTYTVLTRSHVAAPTGTEGDIELVPHAGWSGHADAIAIKGASAWSYVDVAAGDAGLYSVYVADEGIYLVWNGTAWVRTYVVGYALEAAIVGQLFAMENSKVVIARANQSSPMAMQIVCGGLSASENDSNAEVAITHDLVLATDIVIATVKAQAGTATVLKAVCSSKAITVTLSGNGGAGTVVQYVVFRAL